MARATAPAPSNRFSLDSATVNALGYSEALTPVPELPTLLLFVGGLVVLRLRAGGICYPGKASL